MKGISINTKTISALSEVGRKEYHEEWSIEIIDNGFVFTDIDEGIVIRSFKSNILPNSYAVLIEDRKIQHVTGLIMMPEALKNKYNIVIPDTD